MLYASAADGALQTSAVLKAQVNRMLDDPRSAGFVEGFAGQWVELERFDAITIDPLKHYRFNKGIRHSATQEVFAYFATMLKENKPASRLIDSDFVVINAVLGEHYGIEGANSDAFRKVGLPKGSPRGGLLGQTAFLTLGSNGRTLLAGNSWCAGDGETVAR